MSPVNDLPPWSSHCGGGRSTNQQRCERNAIMRKDAIPNGTTERAERKAERCRRFGPTEYKWACCTTGIARSNWNVECPRRFSLRGGRISCYTSAIGKQESR